MFFFSIIIPIYNKEHIISRGINSLLNQTFEDFEIIIIDDGSTDFSFTKCSEYVDRYDNIRLYSQSNKGVGIARNKGIEVARGKYLVFFDVDDIMRPNCLETIHKYILDNNPELLIFGYKEINNTKGSDRLYKFEEDYYTTNAALRENYIEKLSGMKFNNGFIWNKVYEHDFIDNNNLRFTNLKIQQDEVFNHSVYLKAKRVKIIPDILYDYYVYEKGNIRSHYIKNRIDIYRNVRDSFLNLYKEWNLNSDKFLSYVYLRFFEGIMTSINYNLFQSDCRLSYYDKMKLSKDIILSKDTTVSIKIIKEKGYKPNKIFKKLYYLAILNRSTKLYHFIRLVDKTINIGKFILNSSFHHLRELIVRH